MKVIARDNLNRDYYPERLVTVEVSEVEGAIIVDALNSKTNDLLFYVLVSNDYELNLQSMYDVTNEEPPSTFYSNRYGVTNLKELECKY